MAKLVDGVVIVEQRFDLLKRRTVLTERERVIVEILAAHEVSNEEVARMLKISPRTVEKHVSNACRALGLHSREELIKHIQSKDIGINGST
jgi:DNA-binding CsgD family transcriptional regulator